MFLGHLALGLAAKRSAPRVNLATLFAAAQFPDLLWPVLIGLGIERVEIAPGITAFTPLDFVSYPWSHSLAMIVLWGVLFAAVHRLRTRDKAATFLLAMLVVSHWVLDYLSHRPDMPIVPGGARYGLGLWQSVPLTIATELVLFAIGVFLYTQTTRPTTPRGTWAFTSLTFIVLLAFFANVMSTPPSVTAIWSGAIAGALLLLAWAAWADRHRAPVQP
jgi:hypothetical protein